MPIPENHHNLFQNSGALDKLNLFQSLLDAGALTSDEALALLNSIHAELERPEGHNRTVYTQYALVMESLRTKMPSMYQEISAKWQQLHSVLQTKAGHEAAAEDDEPVRKNQTVASLLSKLPQKNAAQKGADKRSGGKKESEELEGEAKEEMEGEEGEEEEETEENEETENDEEGKEKEEGEEEDEKEEGEEEKEKEETEEEDKHESSEQENTEEEHNSREEADHMATEAAEAAHESEHAEVEIEVEPAEIETRAQPQMDEETDTESGDEAEPPMPEA